MPTNELQETKKFMKLTFMEDLEERKQEREQALSQMLTSMVSSRTLLANHFPAFLNPQVVESTNAYGYCLGIANDTIWLRPGFTLDSKPFCFKDDPEKLLEACKLDFRNLCRRFRQITLDNITFVEDTEYFIDVHSAHSSRSPLPVDLSTFQNKWADLLAKDEYLVKVFYTPSNKKLSNGDFHFIRQDRETGIWFHKMGYKRQPDLVRSDDGFLSPIPGKEPTKITGVCHDGFSYTYEPIAYFAMKEPY